VPRVRSGVHQDDYADVRRGGLKYRAAAFGNESIGNQINGARKWFDRMPTVIQRLSGDPCLDSMGEVAMDSGSEQSDRELDWRSLTDDEQRVMEGAIESSSFDAVWAAWLPVRDLGHFSRGYLYVPQLAAAAENLIRLKLVQVAYNDGVNREYHRLSTEEAVRAVRDIDNWWQLDHNGGQAGSTDSTGVSGFPLQARGISLATPRHFFTAPDDSPLIVEYSPPHAMEELTLSSSPDL
jgi:hypothetical protein